MYTLGITAFWHDASATLVKDGQVIAAAEEERFTRQKHDGSFPHNAIDFCLTYDGISLKDVDHIAFYRKPKFYLHKQFLHLIRHFPKSLISLKHQNDWIQEWCKMFFVDKYLSQRDDYDSTCRRKLKKIEHAISHASSAFLASPFDESLIVVYDAIGEWSSTTILQGKGTTISILDEIYFPNSLGVLYQTFTMFLGFTIRNDEYKVMGLSSYGEPEYIDEFKKIVRMYPDGTYAFNQEYFQYQYGAKPYFSKKFIEVFGNPRIPGSDITKRHENIACSLQHYFERIIINLIQSYQRKTGLHNLCIAGGVGLNSVVNGKLTELSTIDEIFVQPAAGDSGSSLGAALYLDNQIRHTRNYQMTEAFLGPEFTDKEVESCLSKYKLNYRKIQNPSEVGANKIAEGKIIGWFQGRMEFGPRALGNRSILADPRQPDMKDIINRKIKGREPFRPFAPSVLEEDCHKYFEAPSGSYPFMLFVFPVKPEKKAEIPAVTHVDGTARIQTVSKQSNPTYWQLINEFKKITSVPVLLNTSFNRRGEPIVCTPDDAINCFQNAGLDVLIINNFLIQK